MWGQTDVKLKAARANRKVLLVEDNPADADLIRDLLADVREENWRHVNSLEAGGEALVSEVPDVVLLDLNLPDGAGIVCVRAARGWDRNVPIVVLTGGADESLALACLGAGAQDYLSKHEMQADTLRRAMDYAIARGREVRERLRAEALKERLAAIVEASNDAIVSSDLDGLITSWNGGAERIFGFSAAEAVGQPFGVCIRAVDESAAIEQSQRAEAAVRGDISEQAEELVRLRKDGSRVQASVVTCLLRDGRGEPTGLAAIARDVTEHRRKDAELLQRNVELERRDRQMRALTVRLNAVREEERTRLSREVHDELGQLLTGLKMDLRWVARRLGPEAKGSLGPVGERLSEAESLVDGTIEAVQRIALELRPSALDALGLSAALRDEARRFERRAGVAVDVELNNIVQVPPDVATALFRIFQELLTNVARHAQASLVTIALDEAAHGWVLRVGDDGVGLQAADEQRLSSLGLLGMRERAEALGGSVALEAARGRGTMVTVSIPRSQP